MIHTADEAYLALGDYRSGAVRFRTGQFVLITEPELVVALERDGAMALLQPLNRAAFLGKAAPATKPELASTAEPAPDQATEAQAEAPAAEPAANTTIAAGKPRGNNRMSTGALARRR